MKNFFKVAISLFILVLIGASYTEYESRVVEFTLPNGLKMLVLDRGEAPVFTFRTYADVGGVDEALGETGLAHLFEHMAFKGTSTIGTRNYREEKKAIRAMEEAYQAYRDAVQRKADPDTVQHLQEEFLKLRAKADSYAVTNEFDRIIEENGGVSLNAFTTSESTQYFYALPSNRLELWAVLESERFADPVLREFYRERDVVLEERRLRTESSPFGRLAEEFDAAAFKAHPYGRPVIGHRADISTVSLTQAQAFFKKYYGAKNLVVTVVGDVDPDEVKRLAEKYFTRIPPGEDPPPVVTQEPPQNAERRVIVFDVAQPQLLVGYHTVEFVHPDRPALQALASILGSGRTSRLYQRLVKQEKIATGVSVFSGTPGNKYPGLLEISATPVKGKTAEALEPLIYLEIQKIQDEGVTPEEVKKFQTRAKASFIRGLSSNFGLSGQLAFFEVITGSWHNLFREPEKIMQVTPEDVQRVAQQYLKESNRTVAFIRTVPKGGK